MSLRRKAHPAFSIPELLISLAILSVIATFTIPKIVIAQQNQRYNAAFKEAVATISAAYYNYILQYGYSPNITFGSITPYMNYVSTSTSNGIDDVTGGGGWDCNGGRTCFYLHNGAALDPYVTTTMGASGAIVILFDPDGAYSGTTNGPGKSVKFNLNADGRVTPPYNTLPDWYIPP